MQHLSSRPFLFKLAAVCVAVGALSACGGGGGDDASTTAPPAALDRYAAGTVHGLGPVQVNGQRYDESAASVVDESGASVGRDALALGMFVEVHAAPAVAAANGVQTAAASLIRTRSEIEGPVTRIDTAAGTLTVLGQTIVLTPATIFEDELRGGIAQVRVGDVVEVYGFVDAAGQYTATRIEREDDRDPYKLRGTVQGLDAAALTFRIGTLTVSYAALPAAASLLVEAAAVRVELQATPDVAGRWLATRIDSATASASLPSGQVQSEIEGVVTAFTSSVAFAVNGVTVDARQVARLPAGLALGSRVEVEGSLANGVLTAREVELDNDRDAAEGLDISGPITQLDTATQRFVVRGIAVAYAAARFEDGTAAQLAVGRRVEVQGALSADGNTLQASEVDFD